jgi:hypothetical protein
VNPSSLPDTTQIYHHHWFVIVVVPPRNHGTTEAYLGHLPHRCECQHVHNANHACDLHDHGSMTLMVYLYNGNAFNWYIKKQAKISHHLTSVKLCPLSR